MIERGRIMSRWTTNTKTTKKKAIKKKAKKKPKRGPRLRPGEKRRVGGGGFIYRKKPPRCKAITRAGKQCKNIATLRRRRGPRSALCRMHTTMKKEGKRVVRRKTRRKTRRRAKRRTRRSRRRTRRRRRCRAR